MVGVRPDVGVRTFLSGRYYLDKLAREAKTDEMFFRQ